MHERLNARKEGVEGKKGISSMIRSTKGKKNTRIGEVQLVYSTKMICALQSCGVSRSGSRLTMEHYSTENSEFICIARSNSVYFIIMYYMMTATMLRLDNGTSL